ncbi:MAG: TIGR04083 family peptide-modifying radical SAM enzyme [Alphaproteobacteria bacterium]
MISTIITKPTKVCNASCTYCSAPPDGAPKWSWDQYTRFFDNVADHLTDRAFLIWHGGEPMLMGPDFYLRAFEYARKKKPNIRFAIQTNLLGYTSKRWREVFWDVFEGCVSTSYDPDEKYREYRGSTELYSRLFFKRLEECLEDGIKPKVIGTFSEDTAPMAMRLYETSKSYGEKSFHVRFNYRYPVGRDKHTGESITPKRYGEMLIELYNRWISEVPNFVITPLDEMLKKTIAIEKARCPWTRSCGGHFLGVEPNGDTYNCSEFADLGDHQYRFGNVFKDTVPEMLASQAARMIRRRTVDLPQDCMTCNHFAECEGGCMRDSVLFDRGLGGKFYYCHSWYAVFDRIKESIHSGEADGAIRMYGLDPTDVRKARGFDLATQEVA